MCKILYFTKGRYVATYIRMVEVFLMHDIIEAVFFTKLETNKEAICVVVVVNGNTATSEDIPSGGRLDWDKARVKALYYVEDEHVA